jgi:hypothetical protein
MTIPRPFLRFGLVMLIAMSTGLDARGAPLSRPDPVPAVFVLPCEPGPWLNDRRVAVFNERLLIALGRNGLVRTLSERDVPAGSRASLPADLSTCTSTNCCKTLGRVAGARIVLHVRVLAEGEDLVVFGTILDGKTGEVVTKKELGRLETRRDWKTMPEDAARWVLEKTGVVFPQEAPAPPKPAARTVQPGLDLEIAVDQASHPETRRLLDELRRSLVQSGDLTVAGTPVSTAGLPFSHRAILNVQRVSVTQRTHHVRHYREGQLAATLTIVDKATQQTVFVRRADVSVSELAEHTDDQVVLGKLVEAVVRDWMSFYANENVANKVRTTNP